MTSAGGRGTYRQNVEVRQSNNKLLFDNNTFRTNLSIKSAFRPVVVAPLLLSSVFNRATVHFPYSAIMFVMTTFANDSFLLCHLRIDLRRCPIAIEVVDMQTAKIQLNSGLAKYILYGSA